MKQRLCCSRTESFNSFFYNYLLIFVGRGGTLVDSMPLDRKVVGSNPILAVSPSRQGPWASPSLTVYNIYYILQGCTARGPDPTPERVLSGPRSRLKIQETSSA